MSDDEDFWPAAPAPQRRFADLVGATGAAEPGVWSFIRMQRSKSGPPAMASPSAGTAQNSRGTRPLAVTGKGFQPFSPVNISHPDTDRYPKYAAARKVTCEVKVRG